MLTLPEIDSLERTPAGLRLHIKLPPELEYFEGHFAEARLLPGVVQIGWAIELARLHLATGAAARFRSLSAVKFMRVLQPGASVWLSLALDTDSRTLQFEYRDGETTCSCGRVQFH